MKTDPGSNFEFSLVEAHAEKTTAENSASVDHAKGSSVSFLINTSLVDAGASAAVKAQYSADDTNWTDDTSVTAITVTAAGLARLDVPAPKGRYSRAVVTPAVDGVTYSIIAVLGPLRHVEPSS